MDLTLQDGTPYVGWFNLHLAREKGEWKVVVFRETEPAMSGVSFTVGKEEGPRKVLQDYLGDLAANRYGEAGKLLVGPDRKAHEASAFILGRAPVIKEAGTVELTPVWRRGKILKALAEYQVDGREARVLVLFYRTGKGWRIAGIDGLNGSSVGDK